MADPAREPQKGETFVYSGIDREIRDTLKAGLLVRGLADLQQVFRPDWLTATLMARTKSVFVDGPDVRVRNVLSRTSVAGSPVPVIWIASAAQRDLAKPDVREQVNAVWAWPFLVSGQPLDSVAQLETVVETPVLVPSGVGEAEDERLAFIDTAGLETSAPSPRLQRIVDWVTAYFNTSLAFVNLIGHEMQTAKVSSGLPDGLVVDMPRELSICQYVVSGQQPVIVPDVLASDFFRDAGVAAMIGVQAYAGMPLVNEQDMALGSLCMMDMEPREMALTEVDVLRAMAAAVIDHLEETNSVPQLRFSRQRFHRIGRALLADATRLGEPLSIASLPGSVVDHVAQAGLEFCTVSDDGGCLVCLPRTNKADARERLAAILNQTGMNAPMFILETQPGEVWGGVIERLNELVDTVAISQGVV
ncbi:MAG: GAF domain-containing protein [Candidatus Sericytochromatia bacterium]|nr:GAF domain-containing protein [Candidatus Sericytochromatia bacterium]